MDCFVPGTVSRWSAAHMQYCPYDILGNRDYKGRFPKPSCKSQRPRDLCCLYLGSCELDATGGLSAPLDEDGFAFVASLQNTTEMEALLERAIIATGATVASPEALQAFAHAQWALNPRRGASLDWALAAMLVKGIASGPEMLGPTGAANGSSLVVRTTWAPAEAEALHRGGAHGALLWVVCGLLVTACLIGSTLCVRAGFRRRSARKPATAASPAPSPPTPEQATHDIEAFEAPAVALPRIGLTGRTGALSARDFRDAVKDDAVKDAAFSPEVPAEQRVERLPQVELGLPGAMTAKAPPHASGATPDGKLAASPQALAAAPDGKLAGDTSAGLAEEAVGKIFSGRDGSQVQIAQARLAEAVAAARRTSRLGGALGRSAAPPGREAAVSSPVLGGPANSPLQEPMAYLEI